jgi:hypothetical protein
MTVPFQECKEIYLPREYLQFWVGQLIVRKLQFADVKITN